MEKRRSWDRLYLPDNSTHKIRSSLATRNLIVAKSAGFVALNLTHQLLNNVGWDWSQKCKRVSTDEEPVLDFGLWKHFYYGKGVHYFEPRPAVVAYAVTARMLANAYDMEPVELKPRQDVYCYLFKRKDTAIAAVWSYDKNYRAKINLPASFDRTDLWGNTKNLPAGETVLELTEEPVFLTAKAAPARISDAVMKMVFSASQ